MSFKKPPLFALTALLFALPLLFDGQENIAFAKNKSVEKIVESIQKKFNETSTFQGSFKQLSTVKSLKRERVSSGYVYMKKGGKMRWEYKEPDEKYIISDGKTYWFYIPEDEQVMKKEMDSRVDPSSPSVFLTGEGVLRDIFSVSLYENKKGNPKTLYLLLVPFKEHPNISKLILGVNKESYTVTESIVSDYYGNTTKIELTRRKENVEIDPSLFSFSPPDGVRIITE